MSEVLKDTRPLVLPSSTMTLVTTTAATMTMITFKEGSASDESMTFGRGRTTRGSRPMGN